jgi:carbonic anhydrase
VAPNRRTFLFSTVGALSAAALPSNAFAANEKAPMSPSDALKNLIDGNARFVAGTPRARAPMSRIRELAGGQTPFATVLACADSRVPVEIVFDHDPGDIFVVRLAGNFVSDAALGSIEYATAVLKSPLVMVLGHTSCGAVKAAVDFVRSGKTFPGQIQGIAEAIAPAVRESRHEAGDWLHNAIVANVRHATQRLKNDKPLMSEAIEHGKVHVVGGLYDLSTGHVALL